MISLIIGVKTFQREDCLLIGKYFSMNKVSRRSLKIKPQPMFEIMDSAKTNTKTIHLEIGDTSYFDNKNFNFLLKKKYHIKQYVLRAFCRRFEIKKTYV